MDLHQIMLIGCGKMGSAMLQGWLADKNLNADFTIIEPDQTYLGLLADHDRVRLYTDCSAAAADGVGSSTMVVLAVKPQMMDAALQAMAPMGVAQAYLSVAAGISTSWLKARLGTSTAVLRAMPNTPAAVGKGITAIFAGDANDDMRGLATQLLASIGNVVALDDEALMDAVTAVSGSGPAYVFLLVEAMRAAGIEAGLPDELASQLARETVCGAGALMAAVDTPAQILRQNVTSKGGTTAAALDVLQAEDGLSSLMMRAVAAAKARSIDLGN